MATSELAVVDTNVLVYAFDKDAEHFEDSRALVDAAESPTPVSSSPRRSLPSSWR